MKNLYTFGVKSNSSRRVEKISAISYCSDCLNDASELDFQWSLYHHVYLYRSDQVFDATIYIVKDSLRFVKPYSHEFTTFAKRRWVGQSLLDVFSREFKAYSSDYYTKAIESGKIRCNGK